ncbi:MAG: hypothetical protein GY861_06700 [bacterium]|nr:hypothetical protein [bacterium]
MNEKQAADARVEIEKNADDKIFENRLAMANDMGSRIGGVFSAIQSLQTAMMESQLGKLDEQMEAEMVAAGVAEETTQAKIEREIAAAESVGDAETAAEKKKELARTKIQEKYAKKRAEIEYNVALMQWKFNLATAIATAPLTVLNALTAGMKFSPIVAGIYAGLASAAAGIQIGAVAASRPAPPSFQTGGIVSGGQSAGDNMSAQVNSGEMILNGLQQRRLFDMADGRGSNNNMKQVSVSEESTWSEIFNASKNGNLFIDTRAVVST